MTPLFLILCVLSAPTNLHAERILYESDSAYYHIKVYEENGIRYLKCNRQTQSAMNLNDPHHIVYEYVRGMISAVTFRDSFPDVLVVGLGAGTLSSFLESRYPDITMDIVELDPRIVEIAKKYFNFTSGRKSTVSINDGRVFIKKSTKKYDIIFLDAYYGDSVPFHMTTREFLELVKRRLKPGGIVVSNLWAPLANRYHDAQAKTYQAVFGELYLLRTAEGSVIFVATAEKGITSKKTVLERAEKAARQKHFPFDLVKFLGDHYSHDTYRQFSERILTDDFAPVNILQHQKAAMK